MQPIEIKGALTLIPGVYDTFSVAASPTAPIPAGRSAVILGEAEEGVPGSELVLSKNRYTDFEDVRDFYKSGPIVDAARMYFSTQPSPVFGGALQALYVYKTNASTRAETTIDSSEGTYGALVAARYGEPGNLIRAAISEGQAEVLPSKSNILYLPSPFSHDFQRIYNGKKSAQASIAAAGAGVGLAAEFVADFAVASKVQTAGGTARTGITPGAITISSGGDQLDLSSVGLFGTNAQVGDIAYILPGGTLAGVADANAGAYRVLSWTANAISLLQLKHVTAAGEASVVPFDEAVVSFIANDLQVNAPLSIELIEDTVKGSAASLEILEAAGQKYGVGALYVHGDHVDPISASAAATASISAAVSGGYLVVSLSSGFWSRTPQPGDQVRIPRLSLLEGATQLNVQLFVVVSATSQTVTLDSIFNIGFEAVASTPIDGATELLTVAPGFVSCDIDSGFAKRLDSAAEQKMQVEVVKTDTGETLPTTLIGGNSVLELSYYAAAATSATVSIDSSRILTITAIGGAYSLSVNTKKYKTIQALVDYLNAQGGGAIFAKVAKPAYATLNPNVLDMVDSVGILSGTEFATYNGKIKKDYYDWKAFFVADPSIVAFREEDSLVLKSGFPNAMSATFLTGAAVGATSMSTIQAGLDAALKVEARMINPLFSRDSQYDIEDGLTDTSSTWTIDAVNAAVKAHVAEASSTLFKKERFGMISFDGSFADAQTAAGEMGYERLQMTFQRCRATAADGTLQTFLPWMIGVAIGAGRAQAALGTSMLRKPFLLSEVLHVGQESLFTDTTTADFDPDDRGQLETAIGAGLVCMRAVSGFGIRMESPDLSTRSRVNDPEGWVWERISVLFVCDEYRQTVRNTLENFIGNRTSDTPLAVVRTQISNVTTGFISGGSLLGGKVGQPKSLGNVYTVKTTIQPVEALEAIVVDVQAERSVTA